ncbi:phage portal protein [uncultured Arthrobacter sp.]|uniref:phage portal protein n=1 Tax=uncultured Arthrobacter sp. TaxID=114050 RepID=UPI0025FF04AC|nr:phage portal protein [uncultured Arthrobacter sp.]
MEERPLNLPERLLNFITGDRPESGPSEEKGVNSGAMLAPTPTGGIGPTPSFNRWSTELAIRDGYEANEWVHTCVDRIAVPVSSVPWRVSRFVSRDAKMKFEHEMKGVPLRDRTEFIKDAAERKEHLLEPQVGHPLEKLIENPNPFFDRQSVHERMAQHLLLGGNAINIKERSRDGTLVHLWPMMPDLMKPIPDRKKFLLRYELSQKRGSPMNFRPQDVIHAMLPDPSNLYWGIGVLMGAAKAVDNDVEAVRWNLISLANRAAPDAVFALQDNIPREKFEEARRQVRLQYQGADNAHTPVLIGNNAKYYPMSLTPVEMDWIEGRKMNRTSIHTTFGLDAKGVGLEAANEESERMKWLSLLIPFLDRMENLYNRTLSPEFGKDIYCWFDTSNVEALRYNIHESAKSARLFTSMGVPFDVVNQVMRLGFPAHIEGLDQGYLPASTRSIREIQQGINQPSIGSGTGNQNTPPEGGEVVDVEPVDEPLGELMPGGVGEDAKAYARSEADDLVSRAVKAAGGEDGNGIHFDEDENHYVYALNGSPADEEKVAEALAGHAGIEVTGRTITVYHGAEAKRVAEFVEYMKFKWRRERQQRERDEIEAYREGN